MSETVPPRPPHAAPPVPLPARTVMAELVAFLRQPQVLTPTGLADKAAWRTLGTLCAVHVAVLLFVLLPLTALVQKTLALAPPSAFDQIPHVWLVPVTVVIAPVLEELLFRSWQSGRPRALWLIVCTALGALVLAASARGLAPLWSA
ncbi:hypothetical protein MTR62_19900, partial [Novosphingobium sp. 1949]|nr:hypothetical protein [Novosphingobium organovorum]